MGCDIHSLAERKNKEGDWVPIAIWEKRQMGSYIWPTETIWEPFRNRNYDIFSFLAGVRNGSHITPISFPRGRVDDSPSYSFMYEKFRDDCYYDEPEEDICSFNDWDSDHHSHSWLLVEELTNFDYSKIAFRDVTYREFLGVEYFEELRKVIDRGAERIVFWFDN